MKNKISLCGLLFVLVAAGVVIAAFCAIGKSGFSDIYLKDTPTENYGWEYEIKTPEGETQKVVPQFIDDYTYTLSNEDYDAVKETRIMTESIEDAEMTFLLFQRGIEVFLDDTQLYSDFQTKERDSHGYLFIEDGEIKDEWRKIMIGLPMDYQGKKLTVITYFPEDAQYRDPTAPYLSSEITNIAIASTGVVTPVLWLIFLGMILLILAVFCFISLSHDNRNWKLILLFFIYLGIFSLNIYQAQITYYSGLQGRMNRWIFSKLPIDANNLGMVFLIIAVLLLLFLEIWERKTKKEKMPVKEIFLFALIGLAIPVFQYSRELGSGIKSYFLSLFYSIGYSEYKPLIKLCSSAIIYAVTLMSIVEFVRWRTMERRKTLRLLEQSRFARENYELIMQVNEDSRKRNHEMKHHMQTLYALLSTRETDQAKLYIEKEMNAAALYSYRTYSENIVLNSIVGIRLNQAKKQGIAVKCHIYAPDQLNVEDVDLNILLSNMLENSIEACMRMEKTKERYIRLEIRKRESFLFVECENSMDLKEHFSGEHKTIKKDKKNHGYGLEAMKAVAEKYSSIIQIEQEPGKFLVRTNLCLPD